MTVYRESGLETSNPGKEQWESDKPLSERLKVQSKEDFDAVPAPLLRKYVQYARKYVHPHLSSDAATVLQVWKANRIYVYICV